MSKNVSSRILAVVATLGVAVAGTAAAQYEVVQSPVGTTPVSPSPVGKPSGNKWTDLFAYPKGGQSPEQQTRDRAECHDWAVSQAGFDPAQPSRDDPKDWAAKRDGYLRAEAACLQARNYSVR